MSKYPECEKMSAVSKESQAIGEFIETGGYILAKYDEEGCLYPAKGTIEQKLAEYYGIDLNKVEQEKQQMLEEMRKLSI